MTEHDPVELLRQLARAERATYGPGPDPDAVLAQLRGPAGSGEAPAGPEPSDADVVPVTRPSRRRRRRVLVAAVAALALGACGTVAWAVTRKERATIPTAIACFEVADVDASRIGLLNDGRDPIDQCREAWQRAAAQLGWGPPPTQSAACKYPTGIIAVFPGNESTCALLGLPDLDGSLSEQDRAIITVQHAASDLFTTLGCISNEQVIAETKRLMEDAGVEGWTYRMDRPNTAAEPCGGVGFDVEAKEVFVISMSDTFQPATATTTVGLVD